jgi:hypothetical protein
MAKKHDKEYELDFVNYQEVGLSRVTRKDERWLNSKDAKREVKSQAKEDRKRGKR